MYLISTVLKPEALMFARVLSGALLLYIKIKEMFKRPTIKKPKISPCEAADAIFSKLFKEEVDRAVLRIKFRLSDHTQAVRRDKMNLILISLYVFIVDYSASSVYNDSKTKNKLLHAFYMLIRQEFSNYYDFIVELAQRFGRSYRINPEEPLFGLGICFSNYIKKSDKNDILAAMAGTTEAAKKIKLVSGFYKHLNKEYRIN